MLDSEERTALKERHNENIQTIYAPKKAEIKKIYTNRMEEIFSGFDKGHYLEDQALDQLINEITREITEKNAYLRKPELVCIDRRVAVNAYCTGEGLLGINIGLLHRAKTMDEVAFILAHEMSHWHLDHVNTLVQELTTKTSASQLRKSGKYKELSNGNIEVLKSIVYSRYGYTREKEEAADSMAFVLLKNTKYNASSYTSAFDLLDSAKIPKYTAKVNLDEWVHFDDYPFKGKWLSPLEESALKNPNATHFIFDKDSLNSHPNIARRRAKIESMDTITPVSRNSELDSALQRKMDLEVISSAMKVKSFPFALYHLLSMKNLMPEHDYLERALAHLFCQLYFLKKNHEFGKYIPIYADSDHPFQEEIVFLNNLRMSEYRRLAYRQYTKRTRLENLDEEEHYHFYLLLKDQERTDEISMVQSEYLKKFPNGKFINEITTK